MSRLLAQLRCSRQDPRSHVTPFSACVSRPLKPRLPGGPLVVCWLLLAVASVGALGGCGQGKSKSGSDAEEEAGHAYEHHNPPHKPRDFPRGLAALHQRCAELFKSSTPKSPQEQKEFDKLVDIVNWLPELAADSDLNRAEWDRVNEHSKQLGRDVDEYARGGLGPSDARIRQRIESDLQALDEVVRRHPDMFGQKSPFEIKDNAPKNGAQYVEHPRA